MSFQRMAYKRKWMQNGRFPARPPYRFSEVKPLKLKDYVSTTISKESHAICMPQMMEMMACFKLNDFDQSKCDKQIETFQQCYTQYQATKAEKEARLESRQPTPGQTKLTKDQLNTLLSRYPQNSTFKK